MPSRHQSLDHEHGTLRLEALADEKRSVQATIARLKRQPLSANTFRDLAVAKDRLHSVTANLRDLAVSHIPAAARKHAVRHSFPIEDVGKHIATFIPGGEPRSDKHGSGGIRRRVKRKR